MVFRVECLELINEARAISLSYYLSSILYELYRFHSSRPASIKISNNDISKFDYIYQHLISNIGTQRDKLLNSKRIYIINFLLSEYKYCLSERIQFKDIKNYLKLTIDSNYKYKKCLSSIHQGVVVISKIYHQTKDSDSYYKFENENIPDHFYKHKLEIKLSNILCAYQCMLYKPLILTHNVIKNTLMEDSSLSNNIFNMFIPDDNLLDDKLLDNNKISIEDTDDLVSLIEGGVDEDIEGGYYQYPEGEEYQEIDIVPIVKNVVMEEDKTEMEDYDFEEYSDGN